jgi:hypothetical protein
MPKSYLASVFGSIKPQEHLAAVNSLSKAELGLACSKFNYVAQETANKGQRNVMLSYLTDTLKIRDTDLLAAAINNKATLLDELTDYAWLLMVDLIPHNEIIPYNEMVDPTQPEAGRSMLSHSPGAFKRLGVAFRGDNRQFEEFGPEGFVARYAVQMTTGADTEAEQIKKGGTALWRPGEKAALEIPKWRFLASIQCQTSPKDDNVADEATAVWFQYRFLSDWVFHGAIDVQRRTYIMNSTADRKTGVWYDFVRGDDFAL